MRWLMLVLLLSMVALLAVSVGIAHHVRRTRQQRARMAASAEKHDELETEETS